MNPNAWRLCAPWLYAALMLKSRWTLSEASAPIVNRLARFGAVVLCIVQASALTVGCADRAGKQRVENPDALLSKGPSPASKATQRAERLLSDGQLAEARAVFEDAIAADAGDVRAHFGLGLSAELSGDADVAERAYRAALVLQPDLQEAANNLALLLREQGNLEEAIRLLKAASRRAPESASTHANLALALEDSGQMADALSAYNAALATDGSQVMTRVNFGLLLLQQERVAEAVQQLMLAQEGAAGNGPALSAIGSGLRRAGRASNAVPALQAAVAAGEERPSAALLSELALAQRAAGDRKAAIETLNRVVKMDARYGTAHYLLGNMHAGAKRFDSAAEHFARYLELEPEGPHALEAKKRLSMVQKLRRR